MQYKTALYLTFFLTLALASVLPFLALSFYAHPTADDFAFATGYQRMGWWGFQKYFYLRWQGLYMTNALMVSPLNPMIHNRFDLYWLPCWLGIGSLVVSVGLLMRYLTHNWLAATVLLCAYLVLFLYQVPNPAEVLFWLNSNWAYQLSFCLGLLLLLLVLKTFEHGPTNRVWWGAAALLIAVLIGTNFIASMLTSFGIGVGFLLNLRNRATRLWWLGWLGLAMVALAAVVLAPGNTVRLEAGPPPTELVAQAGLASKAVNGVAHGVGLLVYSLINWLGNGVLLAISGLLVPVLATISTNANAPINRLRKSWLLLAGAVMVALPFVPTYLTQGGPPAPRILDIAYQLFILVWLGGLYAAVAWRRATPASNQQSPLVTAVLAVFLVAALATDANASLTYKGRGHKLNRIGAAYRDWLSGNARLFDQQQKKRYQLLRAPGHAGLVLDSLSATPPTIFLTDLSPDTADFTNKVYAMFFAKKYVRVNKKVP